MLTPSVFGKDFFDDLFEFPFYDDRDMQKLEKKLYGRRGKNLMKTDIKDTDKAYELEMDLPGFKKDEIKVSLENGYLTVQAEKGLDKEEKEKETGHYIRKERYAGACQRSFYVGEGVKQEDVKAEFKHGILKLTVPKKEPEKEVEEKTNGAVQVELYGDAQLGNATDTIEGMQLGTIECAFASTAAVSQFVPEFYYVDAPFIFRDADHAHAGRQHGVAAQVH